MKKVTIRIDKLAFIIVEFFIILFVSVVAGVGNNISLGFLCAFSFINTLFVLGAIVKISKRVFSISSVFMLFLSVFHFGQAWLYIFDFTVDEKISYDIFKIYPHEQIFYSLLFCLISYNFIALFWMFFNGEKQCIYKAKKDICDSDFLNKKSIVFNFAVCMFIVILIPVCIYDILAVKIVAQSGHQGLYENSDKLYLWSSAASYFPFVIIIALLSCDTKKNTWKWLYYYAIGRCIFLMVLTGKRGTYVIPILLYVFCKHRFIEKYQKKHIIWMILAVVLFLSLISFVAYGRGNYQDLNFFEFFSKINIFVQTLSEFGSTFITTVLSYRYSLTHELLGGKSYLGALSIFVPMSNTFFADLKEYITIGAILNSYSPLGGGLGGSLFGEMYINFGYYSILITPLYALVITIIDKIVNKSEKYNIFTVGAAIYISYGLWLSVRGDTTDVILTVKRTLYLLIIYWLFKLFVERVKMGEDYSPFIEKIKILGNKRK